MPLRASRRGCGRDVSVDINIYFVFLLGCSFRFAGSIACEVCCRPKCLSGSSFPVASRRDSTPFHLRRDTVVPSVEGNFSTGVCGDDGGRASGTCLYKVSFETFICCAAGGARGNHSVTRLSGVRHGLPRGSREKKISFSVSVLLSVAGFLCQNFCHKHQ